MRKFHFALVTTVMMATVALVVPAGATAHRAGGSPSRAATAVTPVVGPTAAPLPKGYAEYNGQAINLANGWDGATSCLIPAVGNEQCFATQAEAKAASVRISAQEVAAAPSVANAQQRGVNKRAAATAALGATRGGRDDGPCQGDWTQWLWLYQNSNFGANSVGIQGTDSWFDLNTALFANLTSSYINETACEVFAIQTYDGSGPWLTIPGWSWTNYVGNAWNDKITMIYIVN